MSGPTATWLLLIAATLISYVSWLDEDWADPRLTGSIVVAIACGKAWLIGMRFMELREAVWPLQLIFNLWTVGVGVILITMFLQAG
ncbi:cytochrome C oxidase subunit IV family protein [Brevundimonas sp. AAP58]|uniref:cytochrome C oxidase subunit IV family protein n=1 Tax=Brevundimonas sp. AAP58 TaxID=1523422 RepID=UPI0006BA03B7|nr:cytochrome C oxidase subunit IV family protein [Brevundimonas sp. AAP58]